MKLYFILLALFLISGTTNGNTNFNTDSTATFAFDTLQYPNLIKINNKKWYITDYYKGKYNLDSSNTTEIWDALTILPLLQEEWSVRVDYKSYIKYLQSLQKYLLFSKNKFSIVNQNGINELTYSVTDKNSVINSIDYNNQKQKVFWTETQLNANCSNESWQIYEYSITTKQKKKILNNNDSILCIVNKKTSKANGRYISNIKSSPNGENLIFKYTNIEFNNFCTNLFLYTQKKEIIEIFDKCDHKLSTCEFIDNNNIIIVTNSLNKENINLQISNLKGEVVSSTGCYVKTGIKGRFLDFNFDNNKETFYLYYASKGRYFISHYKTTGQLILREEIKGLYKMNYQKDIKITAFDYNILNVKNVKNDELIGTIFHNHDVFDYIVMDSSIISIDESGVMKKWSINKTNNHLLILENTFNIFNIPVNLTNSSYSKEELDIISNKNYLHFSEKQAEFEHNRKLLENDYITFFEMNDVEHLGLYTTTEDDFIAFVKFEIEANMFYYPIQIFHIYKGKDEYRMVSYCGRCINYFGYSKYVKNHIIAILPDNKIGYINNEQLFNYNFKQNKEPIKIKLKIFPSTKTEIILKTILELN